MAFELPALANLVIRCDGADVTLAAGKVAQWNDQSGNANHLTEANATYQPSPVTLAGRKCINFAGAQRLALPAGLSLRGDQTTVLMVASNYGIDNYRWWWSPVCKPQFGTYVRSINYLDATHHTSTITAAQFALFGIRGNGATADVFADQESQTLALSATTTTTGGYIGSHTTGAANFGQFYCQAIFVWNKTLSDAELTQAREYIAASYGIPAVTKDAVVVMTGDSTTRGFAATHSILQMLLSDAFGSRVKVCNNGVAGRTLATMVEGANITADLALGSGSSRKLYVIQGGINDLIADSSAGRGAALYALIQQYCAAIRGAGHKVVPVTMIANYSYSAVSPYETERQSFNALLRAGYSTFADGLIDYAAEPIVGTRAASQDTAYWADATHPNDAGYAVKARIAASALQLLVLVNPASVLASAGGTLPLAMVMESAGGELLPSSVLLDTADGAAAGGTVDLAAAEAAAASAADAAARADVGSILQTALTAQGFTTGRAAKLELLGAATVQTRQGSVYADGSWQVDEDCDAVLTWAVDWTAAEPDSVELRIGPEQQYASEDTITPLLTVACTKALADGTLTITATLSETDVGALTAYASPYPIKNNGLRAKGYATTGTSTVKVVDAKGACVRKIPQTV
jgi:lysophospholipase L1-like esterase